MSPGLRCVLIGVSEKASLQHQSSQTSLDTAASDSSAFDEEGLLFGDGESGGQCMAGKIFLLCEVTEVHVINLYFLFASLM